MTEMPGKGGVGTKDYQGAWRKFWGEVYVFCLDCGKDFMDIHINQNISKYILIMLILSIKPLKSEKEIKNSDQQKLRENSSLADMPYKK